MDLGVWLHGLGLGRYEPVFREQAIDVEVLSGLTEQHLKELGIPLGDRLRLLRAIEDLTRLAPDGLGRAAAGAGGLTVRPGERRQVTVLFADLAGYTALARRLDAEDVHGLLGRFFEVTDRLVVEHGGRIDKHIGDCAMAVFGVPVAHGNDAERAVRAALEIRDAVQRLELATGERVAVHIGVASGQVIASGTGSTSHREYTVTGDSVNLASRLTDRAAAGEVLISDAVRLALLDRITCTATGALRIKGFERPIQAWRLESLRAAPAGRWRLAGRAAELATFRSALAACAASGAGRAVLIRGEAGIGKTRLIEEIQDLARTAGLACHSGLVLDFGGEGGRGALAALGASLLAVDPAGGRAALEVAAQETVARGWIAGADLVHLNDLLGLDQPDELRPVYDSMDHVTRSQGRERVLAALVERASLEQPRLLAVEDVHWADRPSLDFLAALAAASVTLPVVLVMTSRTEGDPLDRGWHLRAGGVPLTTIDLGPLRADEARQIANALAADPALAERCIERAGGNPLFLEQLLRHVDQDDGAAVPGSVQSLVQARLDRLEPELGDMLRAASVLGQRFSSDALAHLLGREQADVEPLVGHLLVRPARGAFLFAHALIRDGVYGSLLKTQRRALHTRAAEWYALRNPGLRARHLDMAEDAGAAAAYLEAAGHEADRFHHDQAAALAARGLELASDPALRYRLACLHADLLLALGATSASAEAYQRALAEARDDLQRTRPWIGLADAYRIMDQYDDALATLERAQVVANAAESATDLTRIHHLRGNLFFPLGRLDACRAEHEAALACARSTASPEDEARALGGLADAEYAQGRMLTAHRHFKAAVELSKRHGLARIAAANIGMASFTRFFANDIRGALEEALAGIDAAARIGHLRAEMVAHHGAYYPLFYLTKFRAAEHHAARALEIAQRLGARRFEAEALFFLAEIARTEGRQPEAVEHLEKALEASRATGMTFFGPIVLGALALALDDPARQRALLKEGEQILASGAVSHNYLFFYRDAAEAMLEEGDFAAAERYAGALETYTSAEPLPWSDFVIRRARALAALRCEGSRADLVAEVVALREAAERLGLILVLPGLELALGGEPAG